MSNDYEEIERRESAMVYPKPWWLARIEVLEEALTEARECMAHYVVPEPDCPENIPVHLGRAEADRRWRKIIDCVNRIDAVLRTPESLSSHE